MTPQQMVQATELHAQGKSFAEIGAAMGFAAGTIYGALVRSGAVIPAKRGGCRMGAGRTNLALKKWASRPLLSTVLPCPRRHGIGGTW